MIEHDKTTESPGPKARQDLASHFLLALVIGALLLGFFRRALFGWDSPLWLDEAYTGAIAIQPTFHGLVKDALNELSGPVYYTLMWAWEKLFGASNVSLRLPSFIFSVLAPLFIILKGHPDRFTRLFWAALAALWIPSFFYATEARSYSLLFLLGAVQITLFMRMAATPSLRNAALWSGLSALFLLTHYHSAIVTGFQGLAYLWLRQKDALRTWPAAFLFAPAAAWMAFHLPLILRFSDPEVAWQTLLTPADILRLPSYLIGLPRFSWAVFLIIAAGTLWECYLRWRSRTPGAAIDKIEAAAVLASLFPLLLVFGLGFFRPNFTLRYLMPFMPGVLLGAAIWVRVLSRRVQWLPLLTLGLFVVSALWEMKTRAGSDDWRAELSWEHVSKDLSSRNAQRLIFTWDNPTSVITAPPLMARVASFFFDRAGKPIPTIPVTLAGKGVIEPNSSLLAVADRPGDAIIWIFHTEDERTLASRHPPKLSQLDPSLTCRHYGREVHGVFACIRGKPAHRSILRDTDDLHKPIARGVEAR